MNLRKNGRTMSLESDCPLIGISANFKIVGGNFRKLVYFEADDRVIDIKNVLLVC